MTDGVTPRQPMFPPQQGGWPPQPPGPATMPPLLAAILQQPGGPTYLDAVVRRLMMSGQAPPQGSPWQGGAPQAGSGPPGVPGAPMRGVAQPPAMSFGR